MQTSTSLQYEPSSELLLITAKQMFLNRELCLTLHHPVPPYPTNQGDLAARTSFIRNPQPPYDPPMDPL